MFFISFLLQTANANHFRLLQPFGFGKDRIEVVSSAASPGQLPKPMHGEVECEEESWDFTSNKAALPEAPVFEEQQNTVPPNRKVFEPTKFDPASLSKPYSPKLVSTSTKAPEYDTGRMNNAYEINFCDKFEFNDQLLATYGLERLDNFVWNASCSSTFFQCSIGQTFVLRCPSENQAFDRAITNCNFRNAVRACPEYDHVLHCSIKEKCTEMEFACCSMPQRCLPISMRCDGHHDCADGDDENNCPSCSRYEFACLKSGRCIPAEKRCDGISDDCQDTSNLDEFGCSRNATCLGKFMCHLSQQGSRCVEWADHCNGAKNCAMGEDEQNCRSMETKFLSCENQKQSIPKQNWCDGKSDCADGSDEKYC